MDADGLTFACATSAETRTPARVGSAAAHRVPDGELVSFGIAGGLDGLPSGTVIDATRIVDSSGHVLWEGSPLGVEGAVTGTILAAERIVDGADERHGLHLATGAVAADLESGVLARSGRLAGCVRVIGDTPARPLAGLDGAVSADGRVRPLGLLGAFVRDPVATVRAARDARRALSRLEEAVR